MKNQIFIKQERVRKKKIVTVILLHLAVLAGFCIFALVYSCPFKLLFHIPCPGCGISRAYASLLSLDIQKAFSYHPLFFTVAPAILYAAHRNILKIRLSNKAEEFLLMLLSVAFIIVYLIRLLILKQPI